MRASQFLKDDSGQFSSMRLIGVLVISTILVVWVWANISSGTYCPLGYSEAGIIMAVVGGKALQSRFEMGPDPSRYTRSGHADSNY